MIKIYLANENLMWQSLLSNGSNFSSRLYAALAHALCDSPRHPPCPLLASSFIEHTRKNVQLLFTLKHTYKIIFEQRFKVITFYSWLWHQIFMDINFFYFKNIISLKSVKWYCGRVVIYVADKNQKQKCNHLCFIHITSHRLRKKIC